MTAIVGLLNKKGIAIAADSAVTFNNGYKILNKEDNKDDKKEVILNDIKVVNSGDKMLRLMDGQSIAVMIVGNSHLLFPSLHHLPWDVIIRWYRKKHDNSGFSKFQDYIYDFLNFVDTEVISYEIKKNPVLAVLTEKEKDMEEQDTYLYFAGYATNDLYPSMCQVKISGVLNGKLNYKGPENMKIISTNNESDILFGGQKDIIEAILYGIQEKRIHGICNRFPHFLKSILYQEDDYIYYANKINDKIIYKTAKDIIRDNEKKQFDQWLGTIKSYSLQEMACLAENMIKATSLHRKITFQQEGVGGLVDLALITRTEGFQWLNRKSWYEPSRNGQYGKFGI